MNAVLPEPLEARLPVKITTVHLAAGLFTVDELSLRQAAKVGGASRAEIMRELGPLRISLRQVSWDLS